MLRSKHLFLLYCSTLLLVAIQRTECSFSLRKTVGIASPQGNVLFWMARRRQETKQNFPAVSFSCLEDQIFLTYNCWTVLCTVLQCFELAAITDYSEPLEWMGSLCDGSSWMLTYQSHLKTNCWAILMRMSCNVHTFQIIELNWIWVLCNYNQIYLIIFPTRKADMEGFSNLKLLAVCRCCISVNCEFWNTNDIGSISGVLMSPSIIVSGNIHLIPYPVYPFLRVLVYSGPV